MIAIPINTNEKNSDVSTLFGKAEYFALINNNILEIVKNEQTDGKAVANWLKSKNVNILISPNMEEKPLSTLLDNNIEVYFAGNEKIEINNILLKFADGELPILNHNNFNPL
jgi:predicted Fe-Mo cluster-binding NifX family protein